MIAPRGKRLSLLIGSAGLAVVAGAVFASRDIIQTAWYAHALRSEDVADQKAAVVSLGRLRTRRAARVLVTYLGDAGCPLRSETMQALKDMGEVAMEPLVEAFQVADAFTGKPERRLPRDHSGVDVMLAVLLEIQREVPGVKSLLENIGSRLDAPPFGDLAWKSGVQVIEGRPCRIFLFAWTNGGWPGGQPQTILITDVAGKVITWKEVGGEPFFLSCELQTINGAVFLVVTCEERTWLIPGKYTYRLTLRGIDP